MAGESWIFVCIMAGHEGIMHFVWSWILSFCSHPYCALLVMIQHIKLKVTLQREAYCDINTHGCTEIFFEVKKGLRVNIGLYGTK